MKRILVCSALRPGRAHGIRAANIVLFELVRALAAQAAARIGLIVAWNSAPPASTDAERAAADDLRAMGVHLLPEAVVEANARRPRIARWLAPSLRELHPEVAARDTLSRAIEPFGPDVLFTVWTEWLTAALSTFPADKFAYYGNPDLKSMTARMNFFWQIGELGWADYLRGKLTAARLEPLHLEAMRRYRWLGDVAANDAEYYSRNHHPCAFYIQNTWPDSMGSSWREKRDRAELADNKIVASIGKLGGTANTLGLHYLGTQYAPALTRVMHEDFTLRIFGAGSTHPAVEKTLQHKCVQKAGFVDDIDGEILASKIFLCLNNATDYKVGHTRYLHAWSLGACVVAHRDAALSMPEIVHGENALLGSDAEEIAELTKEALSDKTLRRRLGEGGYETFREHFRAEVVSQRILDRIA